MADIMSFDLCPHRELCGGCVYQGVPYEDQLAEKEGSVRDLLSEAGIEPEVFEHIEGCAEENRYRYRNKMEYTFGDEVKDGPLCLGMHRPRQFMSITTVDHCQLVPEDFNTILSYTLEFCKCKGYTKYHKRKHTGLLRNLIIRKGFRTGEIIVNIVTTSEAEFAESEWLEGLQTLKTDSEIVGVMHTLDDDIADSVNPDETRLLYGRDHYNEKISGLDFKVHEYSFFQTNIEAVERLYSKAFSLIDSVDGKNVFDLYCGTGTISQIAARNAAHVTGIEIVPESVEMARENAALNGLDNCDFICGDVFDVLDSFDDKGISEKPDVIIVDPPRAGMSPEAVQNISSYRVDEIVYISCNPVSLAKNLSQFNESGYIVKYIKPFDNFPMTSHVETVVLMSRKYT